MQQDLYTTQYDYISGDSDCHRQSNDEKTIGTANGVNVISREKHDADYTLNTTAIISRYCLQISTEFLTIDADNGPRRISAMGVYN
jgi:hypothetical protein